MKVDLNCDLGEGEHPNHTRELMRWVTSANIACGGHAGDEESMRHSVSLAREFGVNVGAHPGPIDRDGKGRGNLVLNPGELEQIITPQIEALLAVADKHGASVHHIKLHGGLYHAVESDEALAAEYVETVQTNWQQFTIVGFAGGQVVRAAREAGQPAWEEAFADRAYQQNGQLVPRSAPNAVLDHCPGVVDRVRQLIGDGEIRAVCGSRVNIRCDTICVHSDSPNALEVVRAISELLSGEETGRPYDA